MNSTKKTSPEEKGVFLPCGESRGGGSGRTGRVLGEFPCFCERDILVL